MRNVWILWFLQTMSLHISPWWYSLTQECDSSYKNMSIVSYNNILQHTQLNLFDIWLQWTRSCWTHTYNALTLRWLFGLHGDRDRIISVDPAESHGELF